MSQYSIRIFKNIQSIETLCANFRNNLQKTIITSEKVPLTIYNFFGARNTTHTKIKNIRLEELWSEKYKYVGYKTLPFIETNKISLFSRAYIFEILEIFKLYHIPVDPYRVKLRMSKSPWNYTAHFDCTNQYIVELSGHRHFLLWYENISLLQLEEIRPLNLHKTQKYLEHIHIKTEYVILREGEVMYLPRFVWHKTEIVERGIGALFNFIALTPDMHDEETSSLCTDIFRYYWKEQSNNCRKKNGIDYTIKK